MYIKIYSVHTCRYYIYIYIYIYVYIYIYCIIESHACLYILEVECPNFKLFLGMWVLSCAVVSTTSRGGSDSLLCNKRRGGGGGGGGGTRPKFASATQAQT